jgi:two-component system, NtrC family, nitrogen regulation response regulator NtrX
MKRPRVLVADDEPGIRSSLCGVLEDEGFNASAVDSGEACLEAVRREQYDLVLLDIWLPGIDGLETLARMEEIPEAARPAVVVISGHGNIESAVRATKLGAFDFLEKPLTIQKVIVVVKNALLQREMQRQLRSLREESGPLPLIVGESVPMKALRQQMSLMAAANGRVLIFGESGTGKELVAQSIHAMSKRAQAAFVEVNCAAIPEELIESELFGHRKGSFTGASDDKIGKLQKADGGTLFLDEVADMSLKTQAKVLRALEEQRFEPLGSNQSIQVDTRVIAATNKNLEQEIEAGNFREDLFYRLNVVPFWVPPLRERVGDIRLLAEYFLNDFTSSYAQPAKQLTPAAVEAMMDYRWPGNVRELKNLMERVVILNPQARIEARHLGLAASKRGSVLERPVESFNSLQEYREAAEREFILKKLDEAQGNVSRAAELLGLERSHLYRKMRSLGIGPAQ